MAMHKKNDIKIEGSCSEFNNFEKQHYLFKKFGDTYMDDLENKVLEKIDDMKDEIVKFLQEIVQIPSEIPPGKYRPICGLRC